MIFRKIRNLSVAFLVSISLVCAAPDKSEEIIQNAVSIYKGILEVGQKAADPTVDKEGMTEFYNNFQKNMAKLMKERFTSDELLKLQDYLTKVGGTNLIKLTEVMLTEMQKIMNTKNNLDDVTLNITKSYDSLIDKRMSEEKFEDTIKMLYMKDHAQDDTKNLSEDAAAYTQKAIKHIKKMISSNFSEDVYRAACDFESSDLGKRVESALEEAVNQMGPK